MCELNNNFFQQLLKQSFKTPDQQTRTASQSSSTSAAPAANQVSLNLQNNSPQAQPNADANRPNQNLAAGQVREISALSRGFANSQATPLLELVETLLKFLSSNGRSVNPAHHCHHLRLRVRMRRLRLLLQPLGESAINTLQPPPLVPMGTISHGKKEFLLSLKWEVFCITLVRSRPHSVPVAFINNVLPSQHELLSYLARRE